MPQHIKPNPIDPKDLPPPPPVGKKYILSGRFREWWKRTHNWAECPHAKGELLTVVANEMKNNGKAPYVKFSYIKDDKTEVFFSVHLNQLKLMNELKTYSQSDEEPPTDLGDNAL